MHDVVGAATNLTNCDREPIHIPGAIQSHGCLLACDEAMTQIVRASVNAAALLGSAGDLIGKKLEEMVGEHMAHQFRNAAAMSLDAAKPGLLMGVELEGAIGAFDIALHRYKGVAIIELERASADVKRGPLDLARTLVSAITACSDMESLLSRTPRLLRGALGYDRVMVYQFMPDGAGKVVSETKRGDLEGFLGQYFPASDIPQQARALYLQNTLRVITDASGERIAITPERSASGEPLDLSFAHLRAVSPIHLEYLRNMGVAASMSISIVQDGQLWGLIACHHYTPRALSMAQRVAAEMVGDFLSLQIEALTRKSMLEAAAKARGVLDGLMRDISYRDDIGAGLREKISDFSNFVPSDGVGLWVNGVWTEHGATPPKRAVPELMKFFAEISEGRVWASHELSAHLPSAAAYARDVSGVMAIPLSQIPRDFLMFFRREVVQTLNWAGDPNKTYEAGPLGDRLTPRKSFDIWKQQVERQSQVWGEEERNMASAARTSLLEVIMRHNELIETERKTADLRQKLLNEELNHRVKNILALIKSLVSQPVDESRSIKDFVAALKGRIMALAQAHDQIIRNDGGGALRALLEAELSPYRGRALTLEGPAIGLDARAYSVLALVLHELATNAAKYGGLSAPGGQLSVHWALDESGDAQLHWVERGGPPVMAPKRRGFGSVLLSRSIPFDLGGESSVSYGIEGVEARVRIPARFVSVNIGREDDGAAAGPETENASALKQRRVLLVEDQLVIAIDVEAMLSEAGAAAIDTAATAAEALRILSSAEPDVCVLDVNLGSGTSLPVADELVKREIPFIFATGYGDRAIIPARLASVPVIRKPYDSETLTSALTARLQAKGAPADEDADGDN